MVGEPLDDPPGVRARELVRGHLRLWGRSALLAALVCAGLSGALVWAVPAWEPVRAMLRGPEVVVPGVTPPPIYRLVERPEAVGPSKTPPPSPPVVESRCPDWMVEIPAGSFEMGSPGEEKGRDPDEKQHRVTIKRAFCMAKTEVTQAQYQDVMKTNPSRFEDCGEDCPVEGVSWLDAVQYCNRLSDREDLDKCYQIEGDEVRWRDLTCSGYRLPTEAEWEYAARAGTKTPYWSGATEKDLARVDWYRENSGRRTHPVAEKDANPWGLYDVHGNVWEWVWDWYHDSHPDGASTDPRGPSSGSHRVRRGGGWDAPPRWARAASRLRGIPSDRIVARGFRVARSLP